MPYKLMQEMARKDEINIDMISEYCYHMDSFKGIA